jgi:pantoate--beta-alanine ligase
MRRATGELSGRALEIIHTVEWMRLASRDASSAGRIMGLVPTMGALHEGHFWLIRAARVQCSPVVVSIFVNPLQFGANEDLGKYPRRMEEDSAALESLGVDFLFAPEASEIYPPGFRTSVRVDGLSERLEGRSRPGHFHGVTTVVLKLLEIVRPDFCYFGRKDAQQTRIVKQMVADLAVGSEIVVCPIVRAPDGLAMSSRNAYLTSDERRAATALHSSLDAAREAVRGGERSAAQLLSGIWKILGREPLLRMDYAEIVEAGTLEPVINLRGECLILLAVFAGKTRLIDNALVTESDGSFIVTI